MKLVEGVLRSWQQHTCGHRWVRARWEDGTYGLRCVRCMAAYEHTWEDIIGPAATPQADASTTPLLSLHRAA